MKVRHIGIVTQDIDQLLSYYTKVWGGKVIYDEIEKVRIVKLKDKNGMIIELLQYESMSEKTLRQRGINHIAFTCDPDGNIIEEVVIKC